MGVLFLRFSLVPDGQARSLPTVCNLEDLWECCFCGFLRACAGWSNPKLANGVYTYFSSPATRPRGLPCAVSASVFVATWMACGLCFKSNRHQQPVPTPSIDGVRNGTKQRRLAFPLRQIVKHRLRHTALQTNSKTISHENNSGTDPAQQGQGHDQV